MSYSSFQFTMVIIHPNSKSIDPVANLSIHSTLFVCNSTAAEPHPLTIQDQACRIIMTMVTTSTILTISEVNFYYHN